MEVEDPSTHMKLFCEMKSHVKSNFAIMKHRTTGEASYVNCSLRPALTKHFQNNKLSKAVASDETKHELLEK